MGERQRVRSSGRPHVVMFPLMAHGHIIPFFDLGKLLAMRGQFLVTLVNTPRNVERLEPMVASACKGDEATDIQIPKNLCNWGTVLNPFYDLELEFLEHMRANSCGRVWSVGPLLPDGILQASKCKGYSGQIASRGKAAGRAEADCLLWLDSHPPSSVLCISFSMLARISYSQTQELVLGLEPSGHRVDYDISLFGGIPG